MGKKIKLWQNPYCNGNIFEKKKLELQTGLTVLVGCNGAGKTTLLHNIKEELKKSKEYENKEIIIVNFNNLMDGGNNSRSSFGFHSQFDLLATSLSSSEGEEIMLNIGQFAMKIGQKVQRIEKMNQCKDFFILLDACDSGLSVDNVVELKEDLFAVIEQDFADNRKNINLYIIVAANEYEMARNANCLDVIRGEYLKFNDYEEYREFVLNSKKEKEKRYK